MRSDGDIHLARGNVRYNFLQLLGRPETAEHFDAHGKRLEAVLEGFEMLKAEDGGGREHGDLLAVSQRFESGAHDHFRLAEAHVSAEQPVHGPAALHDALYLFVVVALIL